MQQAIKPNRSDQPEPVDCIILCGGSARRLWPLTNDISKVVLPIGGRSALAYTIDFVLKSPLVSRIFLVVNAKYADQILPFQKTINTTPIEMIIEAAPRPGVKLGPLGAVNSTVAQTGGVRDLLVIGGDNLFGFKLEDFQRFALAKNSSANAVFHFSNLEDASEYGIVSLDDEGKFTDFQEKSSTTTSNDISTACYFLKSDDVRHLQLYLEEGQDPDSLGNFMRWLIARENSLAGYRFSSAWFDIGTLKRLLAANRHFISDNQQRALADTTVVKPVWLDETAMVERSTIGPYASLGSQTRIIDSIVSDSIIMEKTIIQHTQVHRSIIGPGSVIKGTTIDRVCGPRSQIFEESL